MLKGIDWVVDYYYYCAEACVGRSQEWRQILVGLSGKYDLSEWLCGVDVCGMRGRGGERVHERTRLLCVEERGERESLAWVNCWSGVLG